MSQYVEKNKTDVFRKWLEASGDWNKRLDYISSLYSAWVCDVCAQFIVCVGVMTSKGPNGHRTDFGTKHPEPESSPGNEEAGH